MVAWAAWNYGSCWASGPDDLKQGREKLPANTEFIGVDTYDYWWHGIPYDPVLGENKDKVLKRVQQWHRIRTKYYPEGIRTKVCTDARNPETWTPQCWSDTHALMNALEFAKADNAMMIYIGLSSSILGKTYTTPTETMDAYYDNLKAGPWVGLSWWYFDDFSDMEGAMHYVVIKIFGIIPHSIPKELPTHASNSTNYTMSLSLPVCGCSKMSFTTSSAI
jgi:hypothetical protein